TCDRRDCRANRTARFGDPVGGRRIVLVGFGQRHEPPLCDSDALARCGSGLSHRGRHIPRAHGGWALPWQFAPLVGGVGVTLGAQKANGRRRAVLACFFFGIAPLVLAIAMGEMPPPGRVFVFDVPNSLIPPPPPVMVPTFAVPLALMLDGLVLRRLG